jgi:hypothetical protein
MDALRTVKIFMPQVGWSEYYNTLDEQTLRETPQGPNIPSTRVHKGNRYEHRVLAGFVPLGSESDLDLMIRNVGGQWSDFLRSDMFRDTYLSVTKESITSKDTSTGGDGGRQGQGIYGVIKDPNYFVWEALREHVMEVSLNVPLDTFFLDGTIADMLARMFPGCDLDDPEIRRVGYADPRDADHSTMQDPDG